MKHLFVDEGIHYACPCLVGFKGKSGHLGFRFEPLKNWTEFRLKLSNFHHFLQCSGLKWWFFKYLTIWAPWPWICLCLCTWDGIHFVSAVPVECAMAPFLLVLSLEGRKGSVCFLLFNSSWLKVQWFLDLWGERGRAYLPFWSPSFEKLLPFYLIFLTLPFIFCWGFDSCLVSPSFLFLSLPCGTIILLAYPFPTSSFFFIWESRRLGLLAQASPQSPGFKLCPSCENVIPTSNSSQWFREILHIQVICIPGQGGALRQDSTVLYKKTGLAEIFPSSPGSSPLVTQVIHKKIHLLVIFLDTRTLELSISEVEGWGPHSLVDLCRLQLSSKDLLASVNKMHRSFCYRGGLCLSHLFETFFLPWLGILIYTFPPMPDSRCALWGETGCGWWLRYGGYFWTQLDGFSIKTFPW